MIEPALSTATPAPEEDVTTTLYRAAIGPVSTQYYLPIFSRFEAADHAGVSWNHTASLATLNWLLFRQLWVAALAYVGIVVAVVVLVFGIGHLVFQFSDTLMMALGLGFGLAAFVLPGIFGNAVLHTECRKNMSKALTTNANVADACAQLARGAPTRRRAIWLAAANAAFLLAAVLAYLQFSALSNLAVMPQGALEAGHVAVGRTVETAPPSNAPVSMPIPLAGASAPASASAAASAPTTLALVAQETPQPASPASAAASTAGPSTPVASAASTPTPMAKAASATASEPSAASVAKTSAPVIATPAPKANALAATSAVQVRAKKEPEKTTKGDKAPKPAATASAAAAPKRGASTAIAAGPGDKPFFINVGLFAKPENAVNAHAKLLEAQMPSVIKALTHSKLNLTRVRVGPYNSRADAEAAVEKIKALQLDAVIVQL
ncbi:MAG: SPOR domain-containing protein [Pseudomonadota bacterium]